jgi:hypothetical protein
MDFDQNTFSLLTEEINTQGELVFVSPQKNVFVARPEDTLLDSEDFSDTTSVRKFQTSIRETAFDSVNPRVAVEGGCPACKRLVVSFQRLGDAKKMLYKCLCGNEWGLKD